MVIWWKKKLDRYREKKVREELEEEAERQGARLKWEELERYAAERRITRVYEDLISEADAAMTKLRRMKEQIEDPAIRAMIEELEDHWDYMRPRNKVEPGYAIAAIVLRQDLEKGLHKTPEGKEKIYQDMINTAYSIAREMAETTTPNHKIYHYKAGLVNLYSTLQNVTSVIGSAKLKDPIAKKYTDALVEVLNHIYDPLEKERIDPAEEHLELHKRYRQVLELIEEKVRELEEQGKIPRFWHLSPEEIIGEKKKEGAHPVLERPDRYPAIIQKLLAIHHVLKHHTRGDPALYRAIHSLLQSPYTAGPYGPLIDDYFETLENGRRISPLTHLVEKIDAPPKQARIIKQYMKQIEEGGSVEEAQGKKEFKEAMDQLIRHVRENPGRYARAVEELTHLHGANPGHLAEVLAGILRDYRDLYTGERGPRSLDLDRDALQLHRLLRQLPPGDEERDPGRVAGELRRVIEENIQDEETRNAYLQAIQHYEKTYTQTPRDPREFRQWLLEKKKELGEKLGDIDPDLKRSITNFYGILTMLSVGDSLRELKDFYEKYAEKIKKELGFEPQHGPIAVDLVRAFGDIREKKEDWLKEAKKKASFYTYAKGIMLDAEKTALDIIGSEESLGRVPREKEELFTRRLKKLQYRLAEEK